METTDRKTIVEFELIDHGIENHQYFQGCGVSFTQFDDVATGAGNNAAEAIDDALEQLACAGWDVDGMEKRMLATEKRRAWPKRPAVKASENECYYYVSIRVKA